MSAVLDIVHPFDAGTVMAAPPAWQGLLRLALADHVKDR